MPSARSTLTRFVAWLWNGRCQRPFPDFWTAHTRDEVIQGLIGPESMTAHLRKEMGDSMVRMRGIAGRVANASNEVGVSFETALDQAVENQSVDLETEMVRLADEQIHYEAVTQILQKVYGQIRSSMRAG